MRLTPEAGGIKNNTFRDVPVHQHLIALGFLDLVERANDGPLFCEIGKDGTTTGPAQGVYKRILEAVRSVVPDPKVQPNHAWRYTFKTYGYEAGLDPSDARCDLRPCREDQGRRLHQGHPQEADGGDGVIPPIQSHGDDAAGSRVALRNQGRYYSISWACFHLATSMFAIANNIRNGKLLAFAPRSGLAGISSTVEPGLTIRF